MSTLSSYHPVTGTTASFGQEWKKEERHVCLQIKLLHGMKIHGQEDYVHACKIILLIVLI